MKGHSEKLVEFKKRRYAEVENLTSLHLEEEWRDQLEHHERLTQMENEQLIQYEKVAYKALKKQQLLDLKLQPKVIRKHEDEIRRSFQETIKTQNKQMKMIAKSIQSTVASKVEQIETLRRHKEEQEVRAARLEEQYRMSLSGIAETYSERLTEKHKDWWQGHHKEHDTARQQMEGYQLSRHARLEATHQRMMQSFDAQRQGNRDEILRFEEFQRAHLEEEGSRATKLQQRQHLQLQDLEKQLASLTDSLRPKLEAD
jgi:hypothetical protein